SRQRLATLLMHSLHWIGAESLPPDRPLLVSPYGEAHGKFREFFETPRPGRYDRVSSDAGDAIAFPTRTRRAGIGDRVRGRGRARVVPGHGHREPLAAAHQAHRDDTAAHQGRLP